MRDGRKVMVIVTDGGDTTRVKDFHAALDSAQLANASIYPCWWCPSPMTPAAIWAASMPSPPWRREPGAASSSPPWGRPWMPRSAGKLNPQLRHRRAG